MVKNFLIGIAVVFCVLIIYTFSKDEDHVDFNTQIRPILNDKCMVCHGGVKQQSELSFLFREDALKEAKSGKIAIVPGQVNSSELIHRVTSDDPDFRMPPEGNPLTKKEIKILKKWIKEGAQWEDHWAYIQPADDIRPPKNNGKWGSDGIDQFVLHRMGQHNLNPSKEADLATLFRRVSIDLTGLPPIIKDLEQFEHLDHDEAYELYVDHLLSTPHYGERWASVWLDLARYADSQGYQKDLLRKEIWRYRDWVIHAFNKDMPFDQFTIEQLAGDLLPNPTDDQYLATAFHRNTMTNDEGGTDDEEYRVAAVIDRLNTTYEVWMGTTMSCVQCHSHPYDPIRHDEFYKQYAFFNNTADHDSSREYPLRTLLSPGQRTHKNKLEAFIQSSISEGDTISDTYKISLQEYLEIQPGDVMVMEELPIDSSRESFVFERGNWLVHGSTVKPDVPGFLPEFSKEYQQNRLGFAQWLVSGNNPLTARVIVNRFWEQIFGLGLVETVEDFGTQGQAPSHPDLLDWLANQFVHEHHWNIKPLLKQLVMSKTYRQHSAVRKELLDKDPYNKWLARGPRIRLSAEAIRDQALVISGLYNSKVFGKSVMPHQPEGVWNVIRHAAKWEKEKDGNQYRRALYTFWRRVSPYPSMQTFDAPSREVCVSRRIRTNTPLQALVTLNDPVFVEASEHLAKSALVHGGKSVPDQIAYLYQRAMMKSPDKKRAALLLSFYEETVAQYQEDLQLDDAIAYHELEETSHFKAMSNVANIVLNLDEVIMKN